MPWSAGEASAINVKIQAGSWWPILRNTAVAIIRPVSLLWLPVVMVKGLQFGLLTGATPLIATGSAGWTQAQVSALVGMGQLIAGIAGMTIGGLIGDKVGAKWSTILFYTCWLVLSLTMYATQPLWVNGTYLTGFIIVWLVLDTLLTVATIPTSMRLCNRTVAATQFTLYMAISNFGITLGAMLLGQADWLGGLASLFAVLALANVAAIGIMLAVRFPTRQVDHEVAQDVPQGTGILPAVN